MRLPGMSAVPSWMVNDSGFRSTHSRSGSHTCSASFALSPSKSIDTSSELSLRTRTDSPQCSLLKLSR